MGPNVTINGTVSEDARSRINSEICQEECSADYRCNAFAMPGCFKYEADIPEDDFDRYPRVIDTYIRHTGEQVSHFLGKKEAYGFEDGELDSAVLNRPTIAQPRTRASSSRTRATTASARPGVCTSSACITAITKI